MRPANSKPIVRRVKPKAEPMALPDGMVVGAVLPAGFTLSLPPTKRGAGPDVIV